MLDFAPPNNKVQKNAIAKTKANLEREAWHPALNWLHELRHSSTDTDPNAYETSFPVAYCAEPTPPSFPEQIPLVHYARTAKDDDAALKAFLGPSEQQVFTSHHSDEEDLSVIIQALLPPPSPEPHDSDEKDTAVIDNPLTSPEQSTYTSHNDTGKWDAQATNLKPYMPQISIEYEGEGLVWTVFAKSYEVTRKVKKDGKGLPEPESDFDSDDEDNKADSVIGSPKKQKRKEEEISRRWHNGIIKPVSWAMRPKAGVQYK